VTQYFDAKSAVGGDPDQLRSSADVLTRSAQETDEFTKDFTNAAKSTLDFWQGMAGDSYRAHANGQVSVLAGLPDPLRNAAKAYDTLAGELEKAQNQAGQAMQRSVQIGLDSGDLVGRPWKVAMFVLSHPDEIFEVGQLIWRVVDARSDANDARDRFVASMGGVRQDVSTSREDRRNPDGRGGRRLRNDEIFRRSEGGDREGSHFNNDWAGRAILERYLTGGDDWYINDDPDWSRYMMDNQQLRGQLADPVQKQAQQAVNDYLAGKGSHGSFDQHFAAEIQNGEGIVGYQYLHGTNAAVGGFQFKGDTNVTPLPDGNYEVKVNGGYTWHDKIDPNPIYSTDRWKSTLAEIVTLGQADAYDIHIQYHAPTTVIVDKDGNVVDMKGYPAP
jgi:hypothetical protein